MKDLHKINCYLLDMDGTIYLGDKIIDGALDFIDYIKRNNKKCIFLTNNSSKNKEDYYKKLELLGVDIKGCEVYSSGDATIDYLIKKNEGKRVFLLGSPALEKDFEAKGFSIIKERNKEIDYVVLGFDTTLTYEKLWIACDYIKEGVTYIATHGDFVCPIENNKTMLDAGAMIELICAATGKRPMIIGKPEPWIVQGVTEAFKLKLEELAIVGDRLYTDILTGEKSSITSILVYSGETTEAMYRESEIKADYQFKSIKNLLQELS